MRLVLTRRAARQLADILDYLEERNPKRAVDIQARLRNVMSMLCEYPEAGALTDESETRRAVANPYPHAIFYQIRGDALIIERIRHTARRPI